MALAVLDEIEEQAVRPRLVTVDRRPYRCEGQRSDHRGCNRRVADIEGERTLLVTCERCSQEHAFILQTDRETALEARIVILLALVANLSYDDREHAH